MDKEISLIVAQALKEFPVETRKKLFNDQAFITRLNVQYLDDLKPLMVTIIDYTTPMIYDDLKSFQYVSRELFNEFNSIDRWYEC